MSLIDIKCQEAICITKDYQYINMEKKRLFLGHNCYHDYLIYLYFDLYSYYCYGDLKEAKLILFKIPSKSSENRSCYKGKQNKYSLYPLLDFFNIYGYKFEEPNIDPNLRVNFDDEKLCGYTEIDITNIVKMWIKGDVENKGVLLIGDKYSRIITYACHRYFILGMRPMLRLNYGENSICKPLNVISSIVTVNP